MGINEININNMEFSYEVFNVKMQAALKEAKEVADQITMIKEEEFYNDNNDDDKDYEKDYFLFFYEQQFDFHAKQIRLYFIYLFDILKLDSLMLEFNKEFDAYKKKSIVNFHAESEKFYSPVISLFHNYYEVIISNYNKEDDGQLQRSYKIETVENILKSTGKIIEDNKIDPAKESEIKKIILSYLSYAFPNIIQEFSINKPGKNYKPDIGIVDLKCAIELKFIDNENEYKTAIGGVYEDTKGYDNTSEWTLFYAVFYMTNNIKTQMQIEADFKQANVPSNWIPIAIVGNGGRKKRSANLVN